MSQQRACVRAARAHSVLSQLPLLPLLLGDGTRRCRRAQEAERIARDEHGSAKLAVIAGVGTRNYYRKLGFHLEGPYMCKDLV